METRGSITVFLSLILSLMTALVGSCLSSAQMASARVQIAHGLDIGLYSLFAGYDKRLLEDFHVFYLDGSFGREQLDLGKVYDTVLDYMKPVLKQNYQNLGITAGGITGYRLATDNQGRSFRRQIIAYMEETLGSQGIARVLEKTAHGSSQIQEQQAATEAAQEGSRFEDYDNLRETAQANEPESGDVQEGEISFSPSQAEPPPPVENPIDTIRQIQQIGVLELVLPPPGEVSSKTADLSTLASHRTLWEGMGVFPEDISPESLKDNLLFQEYLLQMAGNYRVPDSKGILSYPMEYILGGHSSDRENLTSIANRLLLIREGINFLYLLSDNSKRSQASLLAASISAALLLPAAAGVIEILLLSCWAFGESILDLRSLFAGNRIPLIKTSQNWQLALENLGSLSEHSPSADSEDSQGMLYEDYLRVLLCLENSKAQTLRCLDVFELAVRGQKGYETFRMDACIDALEVEIDVQANSRKTYQVLQQYGYAL